MVRRHYRQPPLWSLLSFVTIGVAFLCYNENDSLLHLGDSKIAESYPCALCLDIGAFFAVDFMLKLCIIEVVR